MGIYIETQNVLEKPPDFFATFDMIIATDMDLSSMSTINTSCRFKNRPFYAAGTHGFYGFIFADLVIHRYVIERERPNIITMVGAESSTRSVVGTSTKKEYGKMVETVTKQEIYSPIILANSSPIPAEHLQSRRRKLQVTPLLSCLKALWTFGQLFRRYPTHAHADLELFTTLAQEKHKELLLPTETLRSEFLRSFLQNIGSELAPITAFLGGMLAQDVINVLGQREQPIQNFLLFDGEESKGPVYALHPLTPLEAALPSPA